MSSQFGEEFRAGIAIIEKLCSKNGLVCTWKTQPGAGESVRFTLSKGGQELRVTVGLDFITDLRGTKEFQSGLELYLTKVALKLREPLFEEYATMCGIPMVPHWISFSYEHGGQLFRVRTCDASERNRRSR